MHPSETVIASPCMITIQFVNQRRRKKLYSYQSSNLRFGIFDALLISFCEAPTASLQFEISSRICSRNSPCLHYTGQREKQWSFSVVNVIKHVSRRIQFQYVTFLQLNSDKRQQVKHCPHCNADTRVQFDLMHGFHLSVYEHVTSSCSRVGTFWYCIAKK